LFYNFDSFFLTKIDTPKHHYDNWHPCYANTTTIMPVQFSISLGMCYSL